MSAAAIAEGRKNTGVRRSQSHMIEEVLWLPQARVAEQGGDRKSVV